MQTAIPQADAPQTSAVYRFEFRGTAAEYFKIWLANTALTVLTLGVYSAWAKVRAKRYFYANTFLHGANFEYHAKPLSILIARLVIFTVVIGGGVWAAEKGADEDAAYSLAIFLVFLPWAWARGLSFNARNSSYRNVRFSFRRAYGFPYLFNFILLTPFNILFLPWLMRGYHQYKSERHQWGKLRFIFRRPPVPPQAGNFSARDTFDSPPVLPYMAIFWLAPVVLFAAASVLIGWGISAPSGEYAFAYFAAAILLALLFIFKARARMFLLFWNGVRSENGAVFYCDFSAREFAYRILLVNFFAAWLSLGLLHPWAKVRKMRFLAERVRIFAPPGVLENVFARQGESENALGEEAFAAEGFDFDVGIV